MGNDYFESMFNGCEREVVYILTDCVIIGMRCVTLGCEGYC